MRKPLRRRGALVLATMAALAAPALAEEVIAVTADNTLITFDSATPGTITSTRTITGIAGNVLAIDVRPADGLLYAIVAPGRLFRIDPSTGSATEIGNGPFSPSLAGVDIGVDFDPATDRLRVVTDQDQNLRLNANDATVEDGDASTAGTQPDSPLAYATLDPNVGANPNAVAAAHTNNFPAASNTTVYVIDSGLDVLARLGDDDGPETSRNSGVLHTIGPLGVNTLGLVGFDVSRTSGTAFAVLTLAGQPSSRLYRISLVTGAATSVGAIGDARPVRAMTLGPASAPPSSPQRNMVGLTIGGELVKFTSDDPSTIRGRVTVTGLVAGDTLRGIDVRPGNGRLYGLGSGGRLYVLNADTGVATAIRQAPFEVPIFGSEFGFDFNAAGDRLRIVSDAGQNFRVLPDTGAVIDGDDTTPGVQPDTSLTFAAGDRFAARVPNVVGAAYDRNGLQAATTLYGIDSNLDVLVRQGSPGGSSESPNSGILHTIGDLGVDATSVLGFDIAGDSTGLATIALPGGASRLFLVDLRTGVASLLGNIGTNETLVGVSVAPSSNPAEPGEDLRIRTLTIRFDYDTPDRDSITLRGSLPFPGSLRGRPVTVDVGGFSDTFVLGQRGKRRNSEETQTRRDDDFFQFAPNPRDGRIHFDVNFRREDVSDELTDEGMGGTSNALREDRTVRVTITLDGIVYAADVDLRYTATAGVRGVANIR